ncbi:MAG: DUF3786 domain-containing protein [Candidatus Adiutrix sp.]|nr:DUF3786 domain-containing protein [Candidatus Adiutrix sp.]
MRPKLENGRPARPEELKGYRTVADLSPELWLDAAARPAAQAAAGSGAVRRPDGKFVLSYMGGDYLLDLAGRSLGGPPGHLPADFQKALVLLSYLTHAQDLGLAGRMVAGRELNGGDMFFTGPHTLRTAPVIQKFGRDPEAFLRKAAGLGLAREEQGAGYACRGLVLPHIAVGCVLHPADEEFDAALTYTFDAYAHYHLPLDGLWAMINVLAEELAA